MITVTITVRERSEYSGWWNDSNGHARMYLSDYIKQKR